MVIADLYCSWTDGIRIQKKMVDAIMLASVKLRGWARIKMLAHGSSTSCAARTRVRRRAMPRTGPRRPGEGVRRLASAPERVVDEVERARAHREHHGFAELREVMCVCVRDTESAGLFPCRASADRLLGVARDTGSHLSSTFRAVRRSLIDGRAPAGLDPATALCRHAPRSTPHAARPLATSLQD